MAAGDFTFTRTGDQITIAIEGNNTISIPADSLAIRKTTDQIEVFFEGNVFFSGITPANCTNTGATIDLLFTELQTNIFFLNSVPVFTDFLTVDVCAVGNVDLNMDSDGTIDGVVRTNIPTVMLLKEQTAPEENGIYRTDLPGTDLWERVAAYDAFAELIGLYVHVTLGDVNADTDWYQTETSGVINSDPVTFIEMEYILDSTNINTHGVGVIEIIGDGSTTDFYIRHPFGVQYASIQVIQNFGSHSIVGNTPQFPNENTILVDFGIAPANGENYFVFVTFKL